MLCGSLNSLLSFPRNQTGAHLQHNFVTSLRLAVPFLMQLKETQYYFLSHSDKIPDKFGHRPTIKNVWD